MIFNPSDVGWRLGRAREPRGGELWVPWDRTVGVIGPQGSGKTLDLLIPALFNASGAALVTLTKVDDLLLSFPVRSRDGRPCLVFDPFGLAAGLPELVWDPIEGCVDPMVAERRAKAFTAGTIKATLGGGYGDDAARFYAAEAAKVIQAFFHAAALTGRSLDDVLRWAANPMSASEPAEILLEHPHAAPYWLGLLHGALHGDDRTAGNTITTVQQAMSLFFQEQIRRRCVPSSNRPTTDVAAVIRRGGTIYLSGREDPYASASPLMTAVAEHVLDTALALANLSRWGRLCPPLLACLDELPSTAPLPTLRTRMANERALGISFIYAAQTWRQLAAIFGEQEARALFGLTNVFGDVRRLKGWHLQPGDLRSGRAGPCHAADLADRGDGRPHLLRRGYCDYAAAAKRGLVLVGGCGHLVEPRACLGCRRCHPDLLAAPSSPGARDRRPGRSAPPRRSSAHQRRAGGLALP
jgi:type IV secretion system protein VirD4